MIPWLHSIFINHCYMKILSVPVDFDIHKNHKQENFDIRSTLVCNKLVDFSDVVGASPVGAAPTTSPFSN